MQSVPISGVDGLTGKSAPAGGATPDEKRNDQSGLTQSQVDPFLEPCPLEGTRNRPERRFSSREVMTRPSGNAKRTLTA
jgi:hypothetical protein